MSVDVACRVSCCSELALPLLWATSERQNRRSSLEIESGMAQCFQSEDTPSRSFRMQVRIANVIALAVGDPTTTTEGRGMMQEEI